MQNILKKLLLLVKRLSHRYYPVHRLDRVTSGIIVMAKSEDAARKFSEALEGHKIEKTYVARVIGEFPKGETKVNQPIKEGVHDRSIRECGQGGKESLTVFERIATNGVESIVKCHPITGRTHQIRVHLAYLGHPISNDSMYGGTFTGLTMDERKALNEAEKRGLWPPDTAMEKDDRTIIFGIYLQSIHYKSDEFDFNAPMPEWADLNYKKHLENEKSGFFSHCNIE